MKRVFPIAAVWVGGFALALLVAIVLVVVNWNRPSVTLSMGEDPSPPEVVASSRSASRPAFIASARGQDTRTEVGPPFIYITVMGDGKAIERASVTSEARPGSRLSTSREGEVGVPFLMPPHDTSMRVLVTAVGFEEKEVTFSRRDASVEPPPQRHVVTLAAALSISGRLVWGSSGSETGIGGAECRAWRMSPEAAQKFGSASEEDIAFLRSNLAPVATVKTDSVGKFELLLPRGTYLQLEFDVPARILRVSPPGLPAASNSVVMLPPVSASADIGDVVCDPRRLVVFGARRAGEWTVDNWAFRVNRDIRRDIRFRPEWGWLVGEGGQRLTFVEVESDSLGAVEGVMELGRSIRAPVRADVFDAKGFTQDKIVWYGYDAASCQLVDIVFVGSSSGTRVGCVIESTDKSNTLLLSGTTPGGIVPLWPGSYELRPRQAYGAELAFDLEFAPRSFDVGTQPMRVVVDNAVSTLSVRIKAVDELGRELRKWRIYRSDGKWPEGYTAARSDGLVRISRGTKYILRSPGRMSAEIDAVGAGLADTEIPVGLEVVVPLQRSP